MTTMTGTPEMEPFIVLAQDIMRRAYADNDPHSLAQWIITQCGKLGGKAGEEAIMTWQQSIDFTADLLRRRLEQAALPSDQRHELTWAWASWNKLIDPLEPGMLALLSAGDGQGKTAYAETQAEDWARKGFSVAFVHYELNKVVMSDRRTARHTGIPRRQIKMAETMDNKQRQAFDDMLRLLPVWKGGITYVHAPGWTADLTIQTLRSLIDRELCDVVIVDYLEKISASTGQIAEYRGNPFAVEANNVERFKTFSESMGVPVFLLAQMNKAGKGAGWETIDRTAIRGAGEKSEKSNVVILLQRERIGDDYSPVVKVRIDKNTLGRTGGFEQFFDAPRFLVTDIAA